MLDNDFGLGEWIARPQRCCVERGSELIHLAPKAMAVLTRLAASPGEVVTRQQLFDSVWPRVAVSDDALTQRVAELRRAFGDSPQDPRFIETIPKVGFRLICPVTRIPAKPVTESETADRAGSDAPPSGDTGPQEPPAAESAARLEVEPSEAGGARGRKETHRRVLLGASLGFGLIAVTLATLVALAVLNGGIDRVPGGSGTPDVTRFSISLREQNDLHYGDCYNTREPAPQGRYPTPALAFSNDGQTLLFAARDLETDTQQLYVRRLDSDGIRAVPGTEGAYGASFTPDDRWIGFFDGRYLKRVPVEGGDAEIIYEARFNGCSLGTGITLAESTWTNESTLYVPAGRSVVRIDVSGSVVENLATAAEDDGYLGYHGLHPLPGGDTMLLHRYPLNLDPARASVFALAVESGESKLLVSDAMHPMYLKRTGHLLFMRRGTLMAAAFNLASLELVGEPFVVQPGIMQAVFMHHVGAETGQGQLALSQAGHLAFVPGGVWSGVPRPLLRVRPDGAVEPYLSLGEKQWGQVRMSPEGDRLLFGTIRGSSQATAHIHDLARNVTHRLETGGFKNHEYAWSPDGSAIAYSSDREDDIQNVYVLSLEADQASRRVVASTRAQWVTDWSVDGSIIYLQDWDIWRLPPDGEAYALFQSDELEAYARVSPDGAWLAYTAFWRESGREVIDVFVRPFPGPGRATPISNGGMAPIWSRDGTQLFYLNGQPGSAEMMVVDMDRGKPSPARRVMDWPYSVFMPATQFDMLPDGSFITAPVRVNDDPYRADHIEVVVNFATLLERRMESAAGGD